MKSHMDQIIEMHEKFGLEYDKIQFTSVEKQFRILSIQEELDEYIEEFSRVEKLSDEDILDALVDLSVFAYGTVYRQGYIDLLYDEPAFYEYAQNLIVKREKDPRAMNYMRHLARVVAIQNSIDSYAGASIEEHEIYFLAELIWNVMETVWCHGWTDIFDQAFERVMVANMNKVVGPNKKRNAFSIDLQKPEGWQAPTFKDLLEQKK